MVFFEYNYFARNAKSSQSSSRDSLFKNNNLNFFLKSTVLKVYFILKRE